jgi:hypothetical protein
VLRKGGILSFLSLVLGGRDIHAATRRDPDAFAAKWPAIAHANDFLCPWMAAMCSMQRVYAE